MFPDRRSAFPARRRSSRTGNELKQKRAAFDERIIAWADALDDDALKGELRYFSRVAQKDIVKPALAGGRACFNHQTHHRGQAHAMLDSGRRETRGYRPGFHAGDMRRRGS